jgi:Tfp pilus assembly protein PilF
MAPGFAAAHYNLAIALQSEGRHEEAIDHYRRALEAQPDAAEIRDRLTEAEAGVRRRGAARTQ